MCVLPAAAMTLFASLHCVSLVVFINEYVRNTTETDATIVNERANNNNNSQIRVLNSVIFATFFALKISIVTSEWKEIFLKMVQTERRTSQVFRYNNVRNSAPQKKCSVYRVPIILEWTKVRVSTRSKEKWNRQMSCNSRKISYERVVDNHGFGFDWEM